MRFPRCSSFEQALPRSEMTYPVSDPALNSTTYLIEQLATRVADELFRSKPHRTYVYKSTETID